MDGNLTIGVLSLQGGFAKHKQILEKLGVDVLGVRYAEDLALCDGLILPGGESTTMLKLLENIPLKNFKKPIFGTCAGMILMTQLGMLDITVARNAYGRQNASFSTFLFFENKEIEAIFIRAPRIAKIHSPDVKILVENNGEPVCIQQGNLMAASFHPELTNDSTIHQYWLQICLKEKQSLLRGLKTTPTKSFQMT